MALYEELVMRPSVLRLGEAMERKLQRDDSKPDWCMQSPRYLRNMLIEEVTELLNASASEALDEAADVANLAMMYAERVMSEETDRGRSMMFAAREPKPKHH